MTNREFKTLKPITILNKEAGYSAREVTYSDLMSSPMKEAIQEDLTTFFATGEHGLVFVSIKHDKIRLLEMIANEVYLQDKLKLYFVWQGKHESHVFQVVNPALVTTMLLILTGKEDKKTEFKQELDKLSDSFRELMNNVDELALAMRRLAREAN